MRKFIAIISALALVLCVAVMFYGCGADEDMNESTTMNTVTTTNSTTQPIKNDGIVTDESKAGDNGAIGEAITKTSEGISNAVTMVSEKMSEAFD